MKKIILTMIISVVITLNVFTQSAGDYQSIAYGTWSNAANWEIYNGSNWVSATSYPGQNPGTGAVTIKAFNDIQITESVPYPIASLFVESVYLWWYGYFAWAALTIGAESPVSLTVSGTVENSGTLAVVDLNGSKNHMLFIGGSLLVAGDFFTISGDDKLDFTFNTTYQNSVIGAAYEIYFHNIIYNGIGIAVPWPIRILGNATFINGVVVSNSNQNGYVDGTIIFGDNATITGASNASFIDGPVSKEGDDSFTFPIGDEGVYSPLTITAPVGQQELISAAYIRSGGAALGGISDPGLYSVSTCEYWTLNYRTAISHPLNVTVGWTSASGCGSSPYITNVSEVTLAHFNGSTWDNHGGNGIGTTINGSVTWSGVTNFGAFTLGNLDASCMAPPGLTVTNVTSNSATVNWSAVAGSVNYDVDYRATSSGAWINAASATALTSVVIPGLSPSTTYEWRVRANCSSGSGNYAHAFFTTAPPCNDIYEINNTSSLAKTITTGVTIFAGISSAADIDWFKVTSSNNSNTNLEVTLSSLPADYDLYVYNKNLNLVGSSTNSGTSSEVVIYNSNARKATYYIKVIGKGGAYDAECYNLLAQVSGSAWSVSNASILQEEITEGSGKQLLYPNPASEFVYLNFNSVTEGLVNIQIVNSIGQLVKQHPVNTIKGHNQIVIQVTDIRPGMYILRINKGDLNLTRKLMIAR